MSKSVKKFDSQLKVGSTSKTKKNNSTSTSKTKKNNSTSTSKTKKNNSTSKTKKSNSLSKTKKNSSKSKTNNSKITSLDIDCNDDIIYVGSNDKPKKYSNQEIDFEQKLNNIKQALKENYAQQKKLMTDFNELTSLHKKELKMVYKSEKRINSGKHSGFNKPEHVPLCLKKLLEIEEETMPRPKVTNLIYKYFTTNKMYNPETKKEIIPNSKIKKIFGMKDGDIIDFYNLQTWLKKVYDENKESNKE
ncbi:SWIB/MDM2 domain-containing protein [Cotonvirus japonicus]|uniref:SWIB/MDM2 domain-containing protein n=1 Tax=Cotonvirus japonicus TaxID=2811091 RepID=A0ABM7NS88_9VIRU|nr:SWIB/MDM2 domain-containing protein [Cotonvirus japonicus]BCS83022.1 SWIB/MDM2 domain-containing protein [Cotonvirus japonicus]